MPSVILSVNAAGLLEPLILRVFVPLPAAPFVMLPPPAPLVSEAISWL